MGDPPCLDLNSLGLACAVQTGMFHGRGGLAASGLLQVLITVLLPSWGQECAALTTEETWQPVRAGRCPCLRSPSVLPRKGLVTTGALTQAPPPRPQLHIGGAPPLLSGTPQPYFSLQAAPSRWEWNPDVLCPQGLCLPTPAQAGCKSHGWCPWSPAGPHSCTKATLSGCHGVHTGSSQP